LIRKLFTYNCDTEAAPMTSSAVADAVLMVSVFVNVHAPVTVSFWASEAGPPFPQSRFTLTSDAPDAVSVNFPGSKDTVAGKLSNAPPNSRISIVPVPLPVEVWSTPHENSPVADDHCSLSEVPMQFVRPAPKKEPDAVRFPSTSTPLENEAPLVTRSRDTDAYPVTSKLPDSEVGPVICESVSVLATKASVITLPFQVPAVTVPAGVI